jgi:hypothetical protein
MYFHRRFDRTFGVLRDTINGPSLPHEYLKINKQHVRTIFPLHGAGSNHRRNVTVLKINRNIPAAVPEHNRWPEWCQIIYRKTVTAVLFRR